MAAHNSIDAVASEPFLCSDIAAEPFLAHPVVVSAVDSVAAETFASSGVVPASPSEAAVAMVAVSYFEFVNTYPICSNACFVPRFIRHARGMGSEWEGR